MSPSSQVNLNCSSGRRTRSQSIGRTASFSISLSSFIFLVKSLFTNMHFSLVTGWVLTTGCETASSGMIFDILSADLLSADPPWWTAVRPSMKLRVSGERDSKAADMLANKVSPPELGSSTACNMVPFGGISNHVASVCQVEVPLFMPLPFSFAILCTISFSVVGAKSKGTGSPKIDAAAICCSSSRFCFLKNKTPCLCHAESNSPVSSLLTGQERSISSTKAPTRLFVGTIFIFSSLCFISYKKSLS